MSSKIISIDLKSNKRAAATARFANVGWGFLIAWGLATVFTDLFSPDSHIDLGWFWLASMTGAPLGLLCFFLLGKRSLDKRSWRALVLSALAAMELGSVLLELSVGIIGSQRDGLCILAGVLSSLGTAVLTVAWGAQYSRLNMAAIERVSSLSLFVGFISYALVLFLPHQGGLLLVAAFPFLSAICLYFANAAEPPLPIARAAAFSTLDLDIRHFTRLGIGITATTLVVSLFWSFASQGVIPIEGEAFSGAVLSGSVIALALMAYLFRYSRSLNLGTLSRWTLPLIAIAFSLLLFRSQGFLLAATLIVFATQALLNLITFVYFAELARSTGISPLRVFGLGRFFVEFGFLLGILIAPAAQRLIPLVDGSYQDVLFVVLAGLIVAVMLSIATQDRLTFALGEKAEKPGVAETEPPSPSSRKLQESNADSDRFLWACESVSEQFGLTKRESEILPYLAQGYTLPYIRNELYISQSTIDTHVRHIYKKMDLHSKEDLITYVRERSKRS